MTRAPTGRGAGAEAAANGVGVPPVQPPCPASCRAPPGFRAGAGRAPGRIIDRPGPVRARLLKGRARVVAAAAASLAAGCALITAAPPGVEVAAVELRALGLLDQALGVTLCVTNPNRTELSFRRVSVAVDVGDAPLAAGASDAAVLLPPLTSVLVPFAVTTTVRNLGPQLLAVARSGAVEYRLSGTVTLAGSLPLDLPFSRRGRLDLLTAAPAVLAEAPSPSTRCAGVGAGLPSREALRLPDG